MGKRTRDARDIIDSDQSAIQKISFPVEPESLNSQIQVSKRIQPSRVPRCGGNFFQSHTAIGRWHCRYFSDIDFTNVSELPVEFPKCFENCKTKWCLVIGNFYITSVNTGIPHGGITEITTQCGILRLNAGLKGYFSVPLMQKYISEMIFMLLINCSSRGG